MTPKTPQNSLFIVFLRRNFWPSVLFNGSKKPILCCWDPPPLGRSPPKNISGNYQHSKPPLLPSCQFRWLLMVTHHPPSYPPLFLFQKFHQIFPNNRCKTRAVLLILDACQSIKHLATERWSSFPALPLLSKIIEMGAYYPQLQFLGSGFMHVPCTPMF